MQYFSILARDVIVVLCLTRLSCTSEDECKWFLLPYAPETDNQNETSVMITIIVTEQMRTVVHNVTYSMHDEVLMSHRAHLVVLLAPP
jgi:hypothetical protein